MISNAARAVVFLAFIAWTAAACALVHRARSRFPGAASMPWLAIGCALALGMVSIAARPLPQAATCGIACIALAIAADADARTGYLFDAITIPSACVVLFLAFVTGCGVSGTEGCLLLVAVFGGIATVSRGRAMGFGDVKAMATIGAAFGPAEAMLAIAAASASGIVEAGVRGRLERRVEIRFGPHLAVGAAVALAFGEPLVHYVTGG